MPTHLLLNEVNVCVTEGVNVLDSDVLCVLCFVLVMKANKQFKLTDDRKYMQGVSITAHALRL